jgi:6-phosphogluconolactonase
MLFLSALPILLFLNLVSSGMIRRAEQHHSHPDSYPIYATVGGGKVASLLFTPPSTLKVQNEIDVSSSPSWITFDTRSNYAYVLGANVSVIEVQDGGTCERVGGQVYETHGIEPVSGCVVDNCLFVANYGSGSASIISISPENHLLASSPDQVIQYTRQGVGPVTSRQAQSYAHDATASPDKGWVYICDLGSDEIHRIKVDKQDCARSASEKTSRSVAVGSGPRHLSFYKDERSQKQYAYLASELSSTLTAFVHDPTTGSLDQIGQPLLTVPEGTSLGGNLTAGPQRTTAEVVISPDGRFVYVSDRGDTVEDHITIFARQEDGSVDYVDWVPSGGIMPRHFSMSKDGCYLAVAHQTTGNVVILQRDAHTGSLTKTGAVVDNLPSTQFAGFYPPQPYV